MAEIIFSFDVKSQKKTGVSLGGVVSELTHMLYNILNHIILLECM